MMNESLHDMTPNGMLLDVFLFDFINQTDNFYRDTGLRNDNSGRPYNF